MMMKFSLSLSLYRQLAARLALVAVLAGGAGVAGAESTPAELLEEGVYLQEARGDLDAAIEVFRRIVASDQAGRARAAEAQYRLALCYERKGDKARAAEAFEALVRDYPDQARWIEAAAAHLPRPFAPVAMPWADGEETIMKMRLPTGYTVGFITYRSEKVEVDGRTLWRLTNRTLGNAEVVTMLEVDPDTGRPVFGYATGSGAEFGEISYWFEGESVKMRFGGEETPRRTGIAEGTIDNLQAQYLVRQLPLEPGFSTEQQVFVYLSGTTIPVVFEVMGIEEVTVPLGTFRCAHVEVRLAGQTQHFYVTADESRRFIKLKVGEVEIEAVGFAIRERGETYRVKNDTVGFALEVPGDWTAIDLSGINGHEGRARILLRDGWRPGEIVVNARVHEQPADDDAARAREVADAHVDSLAKKLGVVVDPDSWRSFAVDAGAAVSCRGTIGAESGGQRLATTVVHGGNRTLIFTLYGAAEWVERNAPRLDAVARTARFLER